MEIESAIRKRKEIYSSLLNYLETNDEIKSLIQIFENLEILKDKEETISTLQLLSKISDNHHRSLDFFDKLEKIVQYLIQNKQPDFDIYQIFKNNKRFLLQLFEHKIIQMDENIISDIMQIKDGNHFMYKHYFYSVIKPFIEESKLKKIEEEITTKFDLEITDFEEKCQIGENGSYICSLIRQDLVEEFISYVNRKNISLTSQITPSIFETNLFLFNKKTTIIEYATFFGAIQIIRYLFYNKVNITSSLWIYAVHSQNAELIDFLEENSKPILEINTLITPFDQVFVESVICHHNDIADYIKDNFINQKKIEYFGSDIINSLNYNYYPTVLDEIISQERKLKGFCISSLNFPLKKITIPQSVKSIGNYAFSGCSFIEQVILNSNLIKIGYYSFYGCSSLKEISIPSSVTEIGDSAFEECSSLKEISFPSSVIQIGYSVLKNCTSITQVSIPSSITSIGKSFFNKCSSLTHIQIPSSVTSIGWCAFDECKSLKQISIPSSVTSIGNYAFNGCKSLNEISISSSVISIGNYSFSGCSSLVQISIPSFVKSIGEHIFNNCERLKQIIINQFKEKNIELFDDKLLIYKSTITNELYDSIVWCKPTVIEIKVPSFIKNIGNYAFSGCTLLKQISFENPSSVTKIGNYAFDGCSSLTQISIPSSVKSIGTNSFYECTSLTQISIPSSLSKILEKDGLPKNVNISSF